MLAEREQEEDPNAPPVDYVNILYLFEFYIILLINNVNDRKKRLVQRVMI